MLTYSQPLYRPPSEARSLIFQITHGCSHNACTFCGMYTDKRFRMKPLETVLEEIRSIPAAYAATVRRVFLADGDATIYPAEKLTLILDALNAHFPALQRISAYVGRKALRAKTPEQWRELRQRKLSLLYFGLESGNEEVLELMNKGGSADEAASLCQVVQQQGIALSIMVVLGGGGRRLAREHALDTARWVNQVNPRYLSLLTLFLRRNTSLFEQLEQPTWGSLAEETITLIQHIEGKNIIFRANHISNLVDLSGTLPRDRERLLSGLEAHRQKLLKSRAYDTVPEFYEEL